MLAGGENICHRPVRQHSQPSKPQELEYQRRLNAWRSCQLQNSSPNTWSSLPPPKISLNNNRTFSGDRACQDPTQQIRKILQSARSGVSRSTIDRKVEKLIVRYAECLLLQREQPKSVQPKNRRPRQGTPPPPKLLEMPAAPQRSAPKKGVKPKTVPQPEPEPKPIVWQDSANFLQHIYQTAAADLAKLCRCDHT